VNDGAGVAAMPGARTLRIRTEQDIIAARQAGREMARALGFDAVDQAQIATGISELVRNVIKYAPGGGELHLVPLDAARRGLEIRCEDRGPGIADLDLAMQDGYSTSRGLGAGLPGTRRLMHEFEIASTAGKGTQIVCRKWL
jgi:serine/threonine-protein kinase RsbT